MGRPLRASDPGFAYHALNRATGRLPLFEDDGAGCILSIQFPLSSAEQ
jgi:hypothetical protein